MKNHRKSLKDQSEQWTPVPVLKIISEGIQLDGLFLGLGVKCSGGAGVMTSIKMTLNKFSLKRVADTRHNELFLAPFIIPRRLFIKNFKLTRGLLRRFHNVAISILGTLYVCTNICLFILYNLSQERSMKRTWFFQI